MCQIYEDVITLLKFNAAGWLQGGFEKNHKTGKLCQRGGVIGRKTSTNFHHGITFILDVPPPPTIFILCCGKNRPNLNFSEKKFESFSATAAEGLLKTDCSRDAIIILFQFFYLILCSTLPSEARHGVRHLDACLNVSVFIDIFVEFEKR